jgi:hypothetical protein
MKSKLELRSEIKKQFNNETVRNINIAINISKIVRWLHSESTIFFLMMIPFLIKILYIFKNDPSNLNFSVVFSLMLIHFILYKFFAMKIIFTNIKDVRDECEYTIEVLKEIKDSKKK